MEKELENRQIIFEEIEAKIDRLENRVSGMRTEFRSRLNEIYGEIEEMEIQIDLGQQQILRWLKGIFLMACGMGIAIVGSDLVPQLLDRRDRNDKKPD